MWVSRRKQRQRRVALRLKLLLLSLQLRELRRVRREKGALLRIADALSQRMPHPVSSAATIWPEIGSKGGGDLSWDLRHDGTRSKGGGDFVDGASPLEERHDGGRQGTPPSQGPPGPSCCLR